MVTRTGLSAVGSHGTKWQRSGGRVGLPRARRRGEDTDGRRLDHHRRGPRGRPDRRRDNRADGRRTPATTTPRTPRRRRPAHRRAAGRRARAADDAGDPQRVAAGTSTPTSSRTCSTDDLARARRLVAGRELPVRRADLPAWTTRCCASRCSAEHVKPRLLGHWGTTPGLNFVHAHLNRAIIERDLDMIYVFGPGHGGPARSPAPGSTAATARSTRDVAQDERGHAAAVHAVLASPAASPRTSHPRPRARSTRAASSATRSRHAFGAAFDNPDLVVACVVGDGEAETGPLATSLALEQVPRPGRRRRRAADPAPQRLQDRQPDGARAHPRGRARRPARRLRLGSRSSSPGTTPRRCTTRSPGPSTAASTRSGEIQGAARRGGVVERPALADDRPALPQGLDRPARRSTASRPRAAGAPTRCRSRTPARTRRTCTCSRSGCAPTGPRSSSTTNGDAGRRWSARCRPTGERRMSANPHANGGELLRDLRMPDFRDYAVEVEHPGTGCGRVDQGARRRSCATSWRSNLDQRNFRVFAPDENNSNRLQAVLEVTDARLDGRARSTGDDNLGVGGRVMEILSEHTCQGWLEGYLLTGRHGFFSCYEAFIHIVDSMFNQHAKWLKTTDELPWRRPVALPELPADLARLAPGPQRLQPPGPGLHRPRRQQEGRGHPGLPAAGREHPALGRRPLPAQPRLRQRHRGGQAAGPAVPDDGRGDRPLHQGHRDLGVGEHGRRRGAGRRVRLRRATSRPWRRWRRSTSCSGSSPT